MKMTASNVVTLSYPNNYTPEDNQSKQDLSFSFYSTPEDVISSKEDNGIVNRETINKKRWNELSERWNGLTEKNKSMLYPTQYKFDKTRVNQSMENINFIINGVQLVACFDKFIDKDIQWRVVSCLSDEELNQIEPRLHFSNCAYFFTEFDSCSIITKREIKEEVLKFQKNHLKRIQKEFNEEFSAEWFSVRLIEQDDFSIESRFGSLKLVYDIDLKEALLWDSYDHLFDRVYDASRLMFQNRDLLRI